MSDMFLQRAEGGPAPISFLGQSINADGWSGTYASPPTFNPSGSPEYFTLTRQGYTTLGATTTYSENLVVTQRVRQAHPNQASLTTNQVALSDYVYSTDTVAGGATNNSAETSPKPVANFVLPDHQVVGDSVRLEVVAFHRNARNREQVACVEFRATDGTNTVTQVVSTSSVLGHSGDVYPVIGYACDLDISALNNPADITVNAKVFPWIGAAASVLDSADSSTPREFSPRVYRRDTTRAASPYYCYVTSSGNDTTGTVSTNAATAEASPCLTIAGAFTRIESLVGTCSGVIIRLGSGTFTLGANAANRSQGAGEVIITRDPNVARADAIMAFGTVAARLRLAATAATGGWIRFRDISINRTGTSTIQGEATSQLSLVFENCTFNNNSHAATIYSNSHGEWLGVTISNAAVSTFMGAVGVANTTEHRMFRGLTVDIGNVGGSPEGWLVLGCHFTQPDGMGYGSRSASGSIAAFNRFTDPDHNLPIFNVGASASVTGLAFCQNLIEYTSATSVPIMRTSGDSATGNNTHVIQHHNTVTGFFSNGRNNQFYDEGATARTSKLMSLKNNIWCQINVKGDVVVANGARTGNWAYLYGVGCEGEFSQFIDADSGGIGSAFAQAYPGLRANIGTSASVRNDPLFTSYQGTTSGPTAGSGGGTYTLQSGSPAANIAPPVLRFDLAGNTRNGTLTAAGAYRGFAEAA